MANDISANQCRHNETSSIKKSEIKPQYIAAMSACPECAECSKAAEFLYADKDGNGSAASTERALPVLVGSDVEIMLAENARGKAVFIAGELMKRYKLARDDSIITDYDDFEEKLSHIEFLLSRLVICTSAAHWVDEQYVHDLVLASLRPDLCLEIVTIDKRDGKVLKRKPFHFTDHNGQAE